MRGSNYRPVYHTVTVPQHSQNGVGSQLRRYSFCLGLALGFAILPTILVFHTNLEPCEDVIALAKTNPDARGMSGNPFSHYNLCKVRLRLAGLHLDAQPQTREQLREAENLKNEAQKTQEQQQQQAKAEEQKPAEKPAEEVKKAEQKPAEEKKPEEQKPAEEKKPEKQQQQQQQQAEAEEQKPAEKQGEGAKEQPKQEEGPKEQPKQEESPKEQPKQEQQQQQAAGGRAAWHEYDVSKLISTTVSTTATDMRGSNREDWSDFDLPKTQEDIDRLMKLPHVDECFYCKICVPSSALKLPGQEQQQQPQQQRRHLSGSARRRVLSSDPSYHDNPAEAEGLIYGLQPMDPAQERLAKERMRQQGAGGAGGFGAGARGGARRLAEEYQSVDATDSGPDYHIGGRVYNISDIAPGQRIYQSKSHLPNCTMCRGCDHTLEMMASGSIVLGSYYAHEPGGSPSWLFRVRTDRTASGWAVVKVWCVPVLKAKQRGLGMCSPPKVYAQVKLLLAQQKLTAECGFNSIVPKVWVEPLNGVMPHSGFHVKWLGLWADIAEGVSVQNMQEQGKPHLHPNILMDFMNNKMNKTELVQGAIFDLLFSQCDRHQQNIFLEETGKVWLIDNDQVYGTAWRKCGIDSMIVPTTQKFMINHLGFFYVLKYPQKNPPREPQKHISPLLIMDYRCHAPGGAIGKNFTTELRECLTHVSSLKPEEVHEQYGYPVLRMADAVRNRSIDLLTHGYEWTLLYGQPTNQPMHRYKLAPKCCDMRWNNSIHQYQCLTPGFKLMREIPYGNSWHGGPWHGTPGLDTGTYEGGTSFLPVEEMLKVPG